MTLRKTTYFLELEMEGDYEDTYQRMTVVVATSDDKSKLLAFWEGLKVVKEKDGLVFREYDDDLYVDYSIYRVEVV